MIIHVKYNFSTGINAFSQLVSDQLVRRMFFLTKSKRILFVLFLQVQKLKKKKFLKEYNTLVGDPNCNNSYPDPAPTFCYSSDADPT